MLSTANLKKIERNSFRSFTRDGMDYIFFGIALALTALFLYEHRMIWSLALIPLCYWLMNYARIKQTYPRIGYAKLPSKTREKVQPALICTIIAIIILLILGTRWMAAFMPVYLGFFFGLNSAVQARVCGDRLWYIFAVLFIASGFIALAFSSDNPDLNVAVQLWCISLILIAAGLVRFIRFIRKYSIQSGGELNDLE